MSDLAGSPPIIIPTTTAPYQTINITLNNQSCTFDIYTKSINDAFGGPEITPSDPNPPYVNINPVFVDVFVNDILIIGGVKALNNNLIVRDIYLGFIGDVAFVDTQGTSDPYGVPGRLPPYFLRNRYQLNVPPPNTEFAPPSIANTLPGMGTRFIFAYWFPGTFVSGFGQSILAADAAG